MPCNLSRRVPSDSPTTSHDAWFCFQLGVSNPKSLGDVLSAKQSGQVETEALNRLDNRCVCVCGVRVGVEGEAERPKAVPGAWGVLGARILVHH